MRPHLLALLLAASPAALTGSAFGVTMDWVTVEDPSNDCDTQTLGWWLGPECLGSVGYGFQIAKFEVTNAQYAEFLNAKATPSDPLGLAKNTPHIRASGESDSLTYTAEAGFEDSPVNFVSFFDALRFVNWLNNGQGSGDTETGAYTLLGGTAIPSNASTVTRNPRAKIVLPGEDEWHKAAYYDASSGSYFQYPAGTDTPMTCTGPTTAPNAANCAPSGPNYPTVIGSYTNSWSPAGTADQAGNVGEWTESIVTGIKPCAPYACRSVRGGSFDGVGTIGLKSSFRSYLQPSVEDDSVGFRVATPNLPPDCGNAVAGPSALWSPDHRLTRISILGVADPNGDALTITPTGVTQDEPVTGIGTGSGNTSPDAKLSPLRLRAERNGESNLPGNGRVYHISFTAADPFGGTCDGTVAVCVPFDQGRGATCVDQGPLYNSIP